VKRRDPIAGVFIYKEKISPEAPTYLLDLGKALSRYDVETKTKIQSADPSWPPLKYIRLGDEVIDGEMYGAQEAMYRGIFWQPPKWKPPHCRTMKTGVTESGNLKIMWPAPMPALGISATL